jgi:DNA repair exonuclease SbcCD ATPase subunit
MEELNQSEGQTQPEMVPLVDAAEEDIDAFIASDNSASEELQDEEFESLENEPEDKQPEVSAEQPKQEVKKQEPKEEELSKEQLQARLKAAEEQAEKLREHAKNLELWSQKRSNQIGELRKALKDAITKNQEGLQDLMLENPEAAHEKLQEIGEHKKDLKELDREELQLQYRAQSYSVVQKNIPEFEKDLPVMVQLLQADGAPAAFIQDFVRDPYTQANGETLIQLGKRAEAVRQRDELIVVTRQLAAQIEKLKQKPANMLAGLERATRNNPSVTASNGGARPRSQGSAANLTDLSDAELEEFLKTQQ